MSKSNEKAKNLFKKTSSKKGKNFKESFEIQNQNSNPISALFSSHKLSPTDEEKIQALITDRYKVEGLTGVEIERDIRSLFELSSQIRSITKQSLILHGERVAQGQEILKKYKRGAFTAWIEFTYGNRQTAYNFLYYYLLHKELPLKTKELYQKIPYRAAYLLGSRKGTIKEKSEVIEQHFQKSQKDLLLIIENAFPLNQSDRRVKEDPILKIADSVLNQLKIIKNRKKEKNDPHLIKKLRKMQKILNEMAFESS